MNAKLVLTIIGCFCFLIASFKWPWPDPPVAFGWLGAFFISLGFLVS